MTQSFDLDDFLPYLLNQAAEAASRSFQAVYKTTHGLTRTQWRVLAHLGRHGAMTARDICQASHDDKTKVSRAVAGLEADGLLLRSISPQDRRSELLALTPRGREVHDDLARRAAAHDLALRARLGQGSARELDALLRRIIADHEALSAPPDKTPRSI